MIKLKNISKIYLKDNKEISVLKDINYTFQKNKLYCIMGKSGSGKSTLIQILGLLLSPTKGDVFINDTLTSNLNDKNISMMRNKQIGFVFQSFYLNPTMKAYENVMLPIYLDKNSSIKDKKIKSFNLLKSVGLDNRENHYPSELSGGEQQRVAIARALVNDPSIILADEPTGSLDLENEKIILELLKDLANNEKCVIVVSHSMNVVKYADVLLTIENGNLKEVNKNEKI